MEFGDPNENFDEAREKSRLHLVIERLNAAEDEKHSDSYLSDDCFGNSVDAIPPMANHIMGMPFGMQSKLPPWAHRAEHGEDGIRSHYESEALVKNFEFEEDKMKPKEGSLVDDKRRRSNYGDPIIVSLKEECPVLSSDMNSRSFPTVTVSFGEERFNSQQADLDFKVVDKPSVKDDELSGGRDNCVRENVERFKDPKGSSSSNSGVGVCVSSENSDLKPVPNSRCNDLNLVSSVPFPWEREIDSMEGEQLQRSNTELAGRTIPEPELLRLRNVSLRMKERMTVGPAGVTEAVVKHIHEKWKEVEVIKLRFEGPACLNMKRIHEILERKTGGMVIWRSGRSVVLYRGMAYQLPCIQTCLQLSDASSFHQYFTGDQAESFEADSATNENLSEGFSSTAYIDRLLDQLGPRFKDWSGRNRQHQGLATAIVKLWEKSSIAKIAIKRGIPNTSNERIAEEIKKLTGGVLLSRNKEYIVFYRGNDFVTPSIREALLEKEKLATIKQDDEEVARLRTSTSVADFKSDKGSLVAGTLAETVEAKHRWGKPLNPEEREMAKKNIVFSKHVSLVGYLQRKLVFVKLKVRKAEKALSKVQEFLQPADLPTDIETLIDEERALFRTIGLKMKGALFLGRRGIFEGTVENMHLNWKNNQLVKILVKGKNFQQVKHIAISSIAAESGGVLVSLDKTTKGYAIVFYRGKNYQ